ncbi:uncharacterized protein LOC141673224 [Apium graveolens]|uniref:uncharacterized protein LOC141673224 n=1 Tax=Apium graveolens TaxID=4045 RepID=UPI003D7AD465
MLQHRLEDAKNRFHKLKDEAGKWMEWDNGLLELISGYFQNMFTAEQTEDEEIIICVKQSITSEQNDELMKPITPEEVRNSIFQIHLDKALGPDGMSTTFFQKHWGIVGNDVVQLYLKRKRVGKDGYMALKLDMNKAYRIEWEFLKAILRKMGFSPWWVHLVLQCVSTGSYNIVHGDQIMGLVSPSRGIRQDDPLSPYLFIICAEGLLSVIRYYESKKWHRGVSICHRAPVISHMLFADDGYVYCKADVEEAGKVLELLHLYEKVLGQKINIEKLSVFFSTNVITYNKRDICQRLWDNKMISKSGKGILIKFVAQSLPTYAMNVFMLSLEISKDIERSFTRSIWESRDLIKKGIRWNVASGEGIWIRGQPWLADEYDPYIKTDSEAIEGRNVVSLMCMGRREWYMEITQDIFEERDQDCILNTRIEENSKEDSIYWKMEKSGVYYVRSVYRLLQMQRNYWNDNDTDSVWRIKAPPKTLNLLWRALSSCLPTRVQLQQKHVQVTTECPVCLSGDESVYHAPVSSTFASQCWRWVLTRFQTDESGKNAEIATISWAVWKARNELVWNQNRSQEDKVVESTKEYLTQWRIAQARSSVALVSPMGDGDGASCWVKSRIDTVKVMVDAAIFKNCGEFGFGIVARDCEGE